MGASDGTPLPKDKGEEEVFVRAQSPYTAEGVLYRYIQAYEECGASVHDLETRLENLGNIQEGLQAAHAILNLGNIHTSQNQISPTDIHLIISAITQQTSLVEQAQQIRNSVNSFFELARIYQFQHRFEFSFASNYDAIFFRALYCLNS